MVNAKKVTIQTVADYAGVSKKTVSRVLNREAGVRPDTQKKVLETVERLNFKPSIAARSLAGAKSYNIGLIYDDPSSDYMTGIQQGVLEACKDQGYNLMLEPFLPEEWEEHAHPRFLERRDLDGVILMPPISENPVAVAKIANKGMPAVLISSMLEIANVQHVTMDDEQAALEMTEHLLTLGHRRIGFILGRKGHMATTLRHNGFKKAMRHAGIKIDSDLVKKGNFTFNSGMRCAHALLDDPKTRPTAIFASNDHMAAGVIAVAHKLGMTLPEELSVAGFDGSLISELLWPPLTTVLQPLPIFGNEAAKMLLDQVRDRSNIKRNSILPYELLIRESTAPI